jgi:4-amino-4-deoxy-L-arabinose transferase-like glycosyltransferase
VNYICSKSSLKVSLLGLFVILILSIIILSSVPPVSRDALTHHLAVPKLYLKHGGMYEIPTLKFSYYPPNLDLLYTFPLYFGNDIIPKFIHFTFALLSAWLIFSYLKIRTNTVFALIGALFFLSLPVIVKLSITVYVDLGLMFFSTWALINLLRWLENGFKIHFLIISAISCGLALGTKYNGLITVLLLAFLVPYLFTKYQRDLSLDERAKAAGHKPEGNSDKKSSALRALLYGAVFVLIALIVFSPWMIRNYIWTDNPVYPLYNSWFNPVPSDPGESSGGLGHFAIRRIVFKESLWQTLLIPVRIFFEGQDNLPQYFDGKLNPFLFFLPFFAFFRYKKATSIIVAEKKILLAFAVLYLLFAFFKTDMRIRYVAPIIPPLVILAIYGLHYISTFVVEYFSVPIRRFMQVAILASTAFMFGMNGAYIWDQFHHVDPLSYLSGRLDRDTYIQRYRPEYSTIKYANENLSDATKILAIFLGNRRYYSDKEMIFGDGLLRKSVMSAETPENILADLEERKITHMLIRYDMFNHWIKQQLENDSKKIGESFFDNYTHRLFSKAGYGLYQLK